MDEQQAQFHLQDNSDFEGSVISAAKNHYSQGNYNDALKLLLDASNTNADSDVYTDIGNCYYMLNGHQEALDYWNKAIALNPKNSKPYANIGNMYYKNGAREMAISFWLVALISRPEDANTNLNLAIAFNEKNMRFEAIKYFERYIKYCEDKSATDYLRVKSKLQHCYNVANQYLQFGAKCQSEGQDKKAAACYFKSLANYPNLSKTNLNLGSIFYSDKNLELAIKYWTAAMHIDRHYDKIYSNLAISYDLKKEFDYAYCYYYQYMNYVMNDKEEYYKVNRRLQKIKPYINEHPDLVTKHLELAQEHIAKSQFDDAIDEFKIYSILNPEESNQYKDIIKKLETYLNPELDIIAACFDIGNNLVLEGKYTEAKPYFFRIMKLSSPQYLEFSKARAKYSQCEKAEAEINTF